MKKYSFGILVFIALGCHRNSVWQPAKYTKQNPCLIYKDARPITDQGFLAIVQTMKEKLLIKNEVPVCQAPVLVNANALGEYNTDFKVIFFRDDFVKGEVSHTFKGGWGPFKHAISTTITTRFINLKDSFGAGQEFIIGHELAHYTLDHHSAGNDEELQDEADALVLAVLGDRAFRNTECPMKFWDSLCFDNYNENPDIEARLGRLHAIARINHWESPFSAYPQFKN